MARNEARRQKQLAKKKAKRDEKRSHLARLFSDNPLIRLAGAEAWPIVGAWVPENLWSQGLGQPIIARRLPNGQIACAVFLLDVHCLGVKNALWKVGPESGFQNLFSDINQSGRLRPVAPEYLAKLIYEGVAYAQSFDLAPHPDYGYARLLLAGIDPSLCTETFEFGKDGKPYYFRGPHESLAKAQAIAHKIHAAGGHFTIPLKAGENDERVAVVDDLGEDIAQIESWQNQ